MTLCASIESIISRRDAIAALYVHVQLAGRRVKFSLSSPSHSSWHIRTKHGTFSSLRRTFLLLPFNIKAQSNPKKFVSLKRVKGTEANIYFWKLSEKKVFRGRDIFSMRRSAFAGADAYFKVVRDMLPIYRRICFGFEFKAVVNQAINAFEIWSNRRLSHRAWIQLTFLHGKFKT